MPFDEAHLNHNTAGNRYKPFADLKAKDGYDVRPNRDAFAAERLAGVSVLVVVCAKGRNDAHASMKAETAAVDQRVPPGASLRLVTDHFPFGTAGESLGRPGSPVGINFPGYDNRQLALNVMYWRSRLL